VYDGIPTISLKTRSPGVSFYYTIDSTTPTWPISGSTVAYAGAFQMGRTNWLRVVGVRNGWTNSDVASRYYIVQGDTLKIADFERGGYKTPWGGDITPSGCATGSNSTGQLGCTITKNAYQLPVPVRAGDPVELGQYVSRLDFDLHPTSVLSDWADGPGFATISAQIPSSYMGQAHTLMFWARYEPGPGNTVASVPMVVEFAHSGLDQSNTGFTDAFQRVIVSLDTVWRPYTFQFGAFWYPHYAIARIADSTNDNPKLKSWIDISNGPADPGRASNMVDLGLSKWWGNTIHSGNTNIDWLYNVNRDLGFNKGTITKFRWSVLQPSTQAAGLGANQTTGMAPTFRGALLLDRLQVLRSTTKN
jgi:hypothetical protein